MNARWEELLVQATTRALSVSEVLEFAPWWETQGEVVAIIEERLCSVTFDMHVVDRNMDGTIIARNDWSIKERHSLVPLTRDEVTSDMFRYEKVLVNGRLFGCELTYTLDEGMTERQRKRDEVRAVRKYAAAADAAERGDDVWSVD